MIDCKNTLNKGAKYQIPFHKKSSQQGFIRRTLGVKISPTKNIV
jgi:hypothetical protein